MPFGVKMDFLQSIFRGKGTGDTLFGLKMVSDCRNSCRVCPALILCPMYILTLKTSLKFYAWTIDFYDAFRLFCPQFRIILLLCSHNLHQDF